ncbi:type IV pilus twitching motility protein PilT [Demequina aestuarii]|uniref:type IV pilus twitching motility protein PilT n=1 Tax=Demequina aestuarii TaxID=327095 RepID=UPI001EE771F0|nr:type IV pilus twitching motility protein PilT [Demequina aestuarii]
MTSFMPEETPPQRPQQPAGPPASPQQTGPGAPSVPSHSPQGQPPQVQPQRPPAVPQGHFQQAQPSAQATPPLAPTQRPTSGQMPVSGGVPLQQGHGVPQRAPMMPGQPSAQQRPGAAPGGPGQAPPHAPQQRAGQPAGSSRIGMSQEAHDDDLDIADALRGMLKLGASDLHVTTGAQPMVRVDGGLQALEGFPKLTKDSLQRTLYQILTQAQREKFEEELELDFSYALVGEARFRVNLYRQRESVGAAFRVIPYEIKPLEALGIPQAVSNFANLSRGLVLVTGPTGSGKSTTLASLVDLANRSRSGHIMTVEDPIEFLHRHKRSLVNQREVGSDTKSFQRALKHVLRQDPDIILIGELRDLETIQVALTAAETGHLVFATLHTQDAAQTIDRVIDVFPSEQQGQVRTQLATAIQGVLCQALLPRAGTPGRAVAVEVLVATPAIRNLIREGKTHQIHTAMQAGASLGMQAMDQHLAQLVKDGTVEYDDAVEMCHSFEEFNRLCGRASPERH